MDPGRDLWLRISPRDLAAFKCLGGSLGNREGLTISFS